MKPDEIVALIKKSKPKMLGDLPDAKVADIVRVALDQISQQIIATNEGVVAVQGLGNFKIRQVEREKEGQKKTVKVIAFRAVEQKTKEERQAKKQAKKQVAE